MTTATAEVELLDSLLEGSPPCDVRESRRGPQCRKPAVVRIRIWCCGSSTAHFLCQPHRERAGREPVCCTVCGNPVSDWRVT